jgi:hypothetical protein
MSEEPLSTEEPARRNRNAGATYRNIVVGVLAVAAFAIVGLLGTLTFYAITDHMADAAKAKRTAVDKVALAKTVTAGLQNLADTNDSTKDAHFVFIGDLTLFQAVPGGSEYRGLVTAKSQKGTDVDVEVTAYTDGSGALFYEIDPSSNLRLAQIAEKEAPKTCSAYENC